MNNMLMFHFFILAAVLIIQLQEIKARNNLKIANPDTLIFERVFLLGLHGNIPEALSVFDTLDDSLLTERQKTLKQKFYSRFRSNDEVYNFKTTDGDIIELTKIYQNYWRSALTDNSKLEHFDSTLTRAVTKFLKKNYSEAKNKTVMDLSDNFPQYLQEFLLSRRIYAATGKTGMFFDLLMHAKETEVIYDVKTPEDTIQVKVVFMDEILSNGWEDYATMGKYYPGGWATNNALYCVKESYDLESENFLVSYLKHEGKHFADYKKFPKLGGTDLEYRAKLVELAEARNNLYSLISFFSQNAKYDKQNPHGFANYCVIRDLSNLVFNENFVTDMEKWKSIHLDEINKQSVFLLKKNTEELKNAGWETVTDFIK